MLLAAVYSARIAAGEIAGRAKRPDTSPIPDFSGEVRAARESLIRAGKSESAFPVMYIRDMLAETMSCDLGISRNEGSLRNGIRDVDYYLSVAGKISYDRSVMPYFIYSLTGILTLARAVLTCALERRESRGAHYREDFPETLEEYGYSTLISYDEGKYTVRYDKEHEYEN